MNSDTLYTKKREFSSGNLKRPNRTFYKSIACKQALLFGRVKRVSRQRASGEARLASLAQIGELARRLTSPLGKHSLD